MKCAATHDLAYHHREAAKRAEGTLKSSDCVLTPLALAYTGQWLPLLIAEPSVSACGGWNRADRSTRQENAPPLFPEGRKPRGPRRDVAGVAAKPSDGGSRRALCAPRQSLHPALHDGRARPARDVRHEAAGA